MFVPSLASLDNPEAIVNAKLVAAGLSAGWAIDAVTVEATSRWYPQGNDVLSSALRDVVHVVRPPENRSALDLMYRVKSRFMCNPIYPPYGDSWSVLALQQARRLLDRKSYDFILSRALPLDAHVPALILSREMGIPWIANWNDPAPLCMAPRPYGNGPTFKPVNGRIDGRFLSWNLRQFLRKVALNAAWHTFPCERLKRYICSYLGGSASTHSSVIPHVALDVLRQGPQRNSKAFTLCHSGSLKKPRDAGAFLNAVRVFLDRAKPADEVRVKFFGAHLDDLGSMAASLGVENLVAIEKAVPYEQSLRLLSRETVLVIIEPPMEEGVFLPSKFIDYVQTGRPILAVSPRQGTVADLLAEEKGGLSADCTSPNEIAAAIETLYQAWRNGRLEPDFASDRLWSRFSEESIVAKYDTIFARLSHGCSAINNTDLNSSNVA